MTGAHSTATAQDGFSILEMIVAMTILALILGIASQTIVLASRSISAARQQVEDARRLREMMADYQAGMPGVDPAAEDASSPWVLKTAPIDVSRSKMTAVIIERRAGPSKHDSFLTFVPDTSPSTR